MQTACILQTEFLTPTTIQVRMLEFSTKTVVLIVGLASGSFVGGLPPVPARWGSGFLSAPHRLQMDEELRREREREREREADREREKEREREREREKELEREREKERERELERQREQRAREKELLAAKALEPAFLPVAELHGLRAHAAEERVKPSEQLTPTRAGIPGRRARGTGLGHPGAGWLQWLAGIRQPALRGQGLIP